MIFIMPSWKQVNPPYKFKWTEKTVPVVEGSSETTIKGYMKNYKNVSQDIRNQFDVEAKAVQIILIGIDNDIYSTVDACPNACEMWKAIERLKQDDTLSENKDIDKLVALISLSFKKIYKPTNNNLRTSSNTNRANQDNTPRVNRGARNVARECQKPKRANDAAYHKEKMLLCKQEEAGFQLNAEKADGKDDTDDEPDDQELKPHYIEMVGQDDDDLARERDLLASLIDKLKCKIDDCKNYNKLLESSNKTLVDKLKGEIEDFKTKNKSLESSNNHFKEANNELSKSNQLMFKDLKKFQAKLDRYHDVNYASKVKINCAKAKEEMVADLRYFNSLEHELDSLKSQLETQKTQILNEIDRISKEYYYADHMNAILGVYTTLDELTDLQCDYVDQVVRCELFKKELSQSSTTSKSFEALQHAIDLELTLQKCTMRFRNDQIALILGYGDLVQGNITIKKSTCYVSDLKGNDLLIGIVHQTSTAQTPEQNGVVKRRNRTLVKAAQIMLSAAKVPLFFWAEEIAITCFTQMRLLVIPRHEKTPYHIINGRKPSVKFFHIVGLLCYIVKDRENLDKIKEKDHVSSNPVLQCLTTALEHDSLNPGPQSQENVPHTSETVTMSNELEFLFSLMFDELLNGPTQVMSKSSIVNAVDAPDKRQQQNTTQFTTTIVATDIPPLNIQTTLKTTSQALTQEPVVTAFENINQAETNKENAQKKTSARNRWRDVYVRTHMSRTEPKNIKEAMADSALIETMQEELHQFDQLDPNGFLDPHHLDKVYCLKKALYSLKQAPKTWDDELSNFLVSKGFFKVLLIQLYSLLKKGEDILIVQIYVDDIIFGFTNPKISRKFEKLMHSKFEMSMMGELKLFLGIQIHQSPRGIFINQAKYAQEIFKKHGMTSCDSVGTSMATKPLDADLSGTPVDQTKYRSMVRALMYLIASRPVIVHATCYCARYQETPTEKHLREIMQAVSIHVKAHLVLTDYGFHFDKILMYCDSKSAIAISCNPVQHSRTKHIDVRCHFIEKHAEKGDRFKYLVRQLGMRCLTPKELEVLANESA
nr:hypothetical protein [Tanacetum cinerariifolium]